MAAPRPSVTVLMPVHNAVGFVAEAIRSVWDQTYADYEVVVVDDASTDATPEVLRRLTRLAHPRLRLLEHHENAGIAVALNTGLQAARGKYIARMDADDIALPDRLERQVAYLERHPAVGIVGANLQPVAPDGSPHAPATSVPMLPGHVAWMLHVHNCVNHPTVLARSEVLEALGGYRPVPTEDYDLWVRATALTRIANIPHVVLRYRVHPASHSVRNQQAAEACALAVSEQALTRLLGSPPDRPALRVLRRPVQAAEAPPERVREAAALLWRFTAAVMDDAELTEPERAHIRHTAAQWFSQLVRATLTRRPAVAAGLLAPGRRGPPRWLLSQAVPALTNAMRRSG